MIDMARGGARNRSGPAADPNSGRSDRRGFKLTALPAEGFRGEVPDFPLPRVSVYTLGFGVGGKPIKVFDEDATQERRDREVELWRWAWSTPQACAWSMAPWRWHSVAMWVRTSAICESSEATAADKNALHRFADQIGLTPAGLKENGWAITVDEVTAKADERAESEAPKEAPQRRLRAAP